MKVKIYTINKGQPGQYYGLAEVEDNGQSTVLPYTPTWTTIGGAVRYAKKNGLQITNMPTVSTKNIKTPSNAALRKHARF